MSIIKFLLKFIWGLPQNIIGLFLFIALYDKDYIMKYKGAYITDANIGNYGAVSLGQFIFLFSNYENKSEIMRHEYGHTIQSHILGPFYLLVIGIPSFVWAMFFKEYRAKNNISYYDFYTERWADKLGGIKR